MLSLPWKFIFHNNHYFDYSGREKAFRELSIFYCFKEVFLFLIFWFCQLLVIYIWFHYWNWSHIYCASNKLYTCFTILISVEFFLQRSQGPSTFACQNQKQMHIISQACLYNLCRLHVLGFYIHAWTQQPPIVYYQEQVEFENVKCLDKKVQLKDFSICGFWCLLEVREGWSWNQYLSDIKEGLYYKIPNSMMMKTRIE